MHVAAVRLAEEPMPSSARRAEPAAPPEVTAAQDASPPPLAPPAPGDDASLAALVAAAQEGSTAAFERIVAMYQSRIFGFARAYCRDRAEASDLMQEALIKVYRSIGGFRFQSSLLTWIFRIVKNVAIDHHKSRRQKERKLEQPLSLTSEREIGVTADPGPETRLLRSEVQRELWSALERVPEAYRTVLVLADMQGQSYEEIAAIVETPVGTVKSRLFRGRDALREALIAQRREEPRARRSS